MNGTMESLKALVSSLDEAKLDVNTGASYLHKYECHIAQED